MISKYQKYYRQPTIQNAKDLWHSISTYDFSEDLDRLAELRIRIPPRPQSADILLYSNGSTRTARQYSFGPHSGFWLNQMEDHVKFRQDNQYITIFPSIMSKTRSFTKTPDKFQELNATIPIHYMASVSFLEPDATSYLIDNLRKVGQFGLFSEPNNWLYLLSQPEFREFLVDSQLTSAMSTSWEAFYKKPPPNTHFNDNMINWSTGMNFYTCPQGTKHFLPTFVPITRGGTPYGIVNLINLSVPAIWPVDDLMTISPEIKKCTCGRNYRPFTFIPHIDNTIISSSGKPIFDLGLADQLQGSYLNLQFVQYKQKIYVLYISTTEPDTEIITEYFAMHGLQTQFIKNAFLGLNKKYPVFWRSRTLPKYNKFVYKS